MKKYSDEKTNGRIIMAQKYKYLHLVNYNTFLLWDIKRYFMTQVASSHPIVKLGDYIQEEGTKYNISDKTKTYGIASPKAALAFSIYASISIEPSG